MINTKNYPEASGQAVVKFARATSEASLELRKRKKKEAPVELILSPGAFSLGFLHSKFPRLTLYAQHLDAKTESSTTGFLLPGNAKQFGAKGSIINHSEHRLEENEIKDTILLLHSLGLKSIVCARDDKEIGRFASYSPDFLAIEPPELIGSGNAVSKSRPEIITNSRKALDESRPSGSKTVLLCGAGIVEKVDAQKAVELGAEGILVASGVVKAKSWKSKIISLAEGLISAETERQEKSKK